MEVSSIIEMEDENFHEPLIENASTDLEAGETRLLRGKKSPLLMVSQYTQSKRISNAITSCISILAVISVVLNPSSAPVLAMGITSIIIAPVVAGNQKQLVDILALERCEKQLREEVNYLAEANEQLKEQVEKSRRTAGRLVEVEGAFKKTTELHIDNMTEFKKQLEVMRQNANALEVRLFYVFAQKIRFYPCVHGRFFISLQHHIDDRIFMYIVDAAIKFDDDGNDELSDDEAANVISQVRDLFHVEVDTAKFMEVVRKNRSVDGIIKSFRRRHDSGNSAMKIFSVGGILPR